MRDMRAARNCAKCRVFPQFRGFEGSQVSSEKWGLRRIGCPKCQQNLPHACARERFGSRNRKKQAGSEHFWKLSSAQFAPRLRARAVSKSKSLKPEGFGALLEVELRKIYTTLLYPESDLEAKTVKTPGARDVFGGSKCFSRGRRRDFYSLQNMWQAQEFVRVAKTLAGVVKRVRNDAFAWQAQEFRALRCRCLRPRTLNPWKRCKFWILRKCYFERIISRGSYRTLYASAQLSRGRRNTFEAYTRKSLKRIVILRSSVWSTCRFWKKSRRKPSFLSFQASFLKEVSQESAVFEFFKLYIRRKSRRKALFLSFKATCLKSLPEKEISEALESQIM